MLTYFIVKSEWFDTEVFIREAMKMSSNGLILVWNYGGVIQIVQCPPKVKLKKTYYFYKRGTFSESRWIKWPAQILIISWILFKTLLFYKVDKFYIEGGDILTWFAQIFKRLGRIRKTITVIADWSNPIGQHGIFEKVNGFKLRLNDWILMRSDTTVIVTQKEIFDIRNNFWENKTLKNTVLFDNHWAWMIERKATIDYSGDKKTISFLGNMRKNFGIELMFELLPELNRDYGFRMQFIGPETDIYRYYKDLSEKMGLKDLIDWKGFVPLSEFVDALKDCFCGVNIHEHQENNSRFVIAGRLVNYLQYLIVPVLTKYSGAMVKYIQENKMGVFCEPNKEDVKRAILEAYAKNREYIQQINKFLEENPYKRDVKDILNM